MTQDTKKRTNRGFRIFAEGDDDIAVIESSLAFEGAHVWVRGGRAVHNDGSSGVLSTNVQGAKTLIAGLTQFVAEAEAGELTEPVEKED